MARQNGIATCRLQLTVDKVTDRVIDEMVALGIHGPNKAEVASWIIRTWLWENQERLLANGIVIASKKKAASD